MRKQQAGESVDAFVTALHTLPEHCEYGTFKEQLIRDRVVVGLLDADLSERLQLLPDLDFTTAVTKARNSKAVNARQSIIRSSRDTSTLFAVSADAAHSYAQQDKPQRQRPSGKEEKRPT